MNLAGKASVAISVVASLYCGMVGAVEMAPNIKVDNRVGKKLQGELERASESSAIEHEVSVFLKNEEGGVQGAVSARAALSYTENAKKIYTINERQVSEEEYEKFAGDVQNQHRELRRQQKAFSKSKLELLLGKNIAEENFGGAVSLKLTAREIKKMLTDNGATILSVETRPQYSTPSLSSAMLATNVNPYALYIYNDTQGDGVTTYYAEGACGSSAFVGTNYTDLTCTSSGCSNADHSNVVGGIMRAVAPDSPIYCNNTWRPDGRTHALVESYSISGSTDNTYYLNDDGVFDNHVYLDRVNVFVAAGNGACGAGAVNYVSSPAKGMNVISVGSYNDATMSVSCFSRYINPSTKNEKPEVSAPGENIYVTGKNGVTLGGSGTSFSTPHAAAFAADAMSHNSFLRASPAMLRAFLLAGATDRITDTLGSTSDKAVGAGGMDFYDSLFKSTYLAYWWDLSGNSPFSTFRPCFDGWYSDLGVNRTVRVAVSWLLRPEYTAAHQSDVYPLGSDYDLFVLYPNGTTVPGASAQNRYNPYEVVEFNTGATSGRYTYRVCRAYNRDVGAHFDIGIAVTQR